LPSERRFAGSPKTIQICITLSFAGEVKPKAPRSKIFTSCKNVLTKYFGRPNPSFPSPVSPACYQMTLLVGLPENSGGQIRSFPLSTLFHHGSPCSHYHPVSNTSFFNFPAMSDGTPKTAFCGKTAGSPGGRVRIACLRRNKKAPGALRHKTQHVASIVAENEAHLLQPDC
jgi:hypothetical protein